MKTILTFGVYDMLHGENESGGMEVRHLPVPVYI